MCRVAGVWRDVIHRTSSTSGTCIWRKKVGCPVCVCVCTESQRKSSCCCKGDTIIMASILILLQAQRMTVQTSSRTHNCTWCWSLDMEGVIWRALSSIMPETSWLSSFRLELVVRPGEQQAIKVMLVHPSRVYPLYSK